MIRNKLTLLTAVTLLAGGTIVQSAPIVQDDFTSNPLAVPDWVTEDQTTGGAAVGELSWNDTDFYLEYGKSAGVMASDLIFTTSGDFTGNWETKAGYTGIDISFDFYADTAGSPDLHPQMLQVYVRGAGDHAWYLDLTDEMEQVIVDDSWYTFRSSVWFSEQGNWWSMTGSNWESAFTDVTEVGLWLTTDDTTGQLFGLDNFELLMPIPEPGAMMLLGSALLSLSLTFRKKIGVRAKELLNS